MYYYFQRLKHSHSFMMFQKKWILCISKIVQWGSFICPSRKCELSIEEAEQTLKKHGYSFQPLWENLPTLRERTSDLSLIVPVYNSESFLSQCLNSLCQQKTNYHYEVICVNDGSSDGSLGIIEQFVKRYNNIKVHTQENKGISAARNKGIELSTGRYIGFIDNDDTIVDNYVQKLLDYAQSTDADMIQCGYTENTPDGTLLNKKGGKDFTINATDKRRLFEFVQGYIWSGCIKAELFQKIRFPSGFWYEDMITRMLLMRKVRRFAIIGDCLYHKTIHQQNASKILWKNGNIKATDQYWLANLCAEYARTEFGIPDDELLYNTLLTEWSQFLWGRTRGLSKKNQQSVFVLAASQICKMNFKEINYYNSELRYVAQSFHKKNYNQWRLLSLSMLLKAISQ